MAAVATRPAGRDGRRGRRDARARSLRRVRAGGRPRAADRAGAGRLREARPGRRARARRSAAAARCADAGRGGGRRRERQGRARPGARGRTARQGDAGTGPRETSPASGRLPKTASSPNRSSRRTRRMSRSPRKPPTPPRSRFAPPRRSCSARRRGWRRTRPEAPGRVVSVTAPVDGVVLKRVRESETFVPAGDPLIEIGDPGQLEIVADLLSTDAVRVKAGARAIRRAMGRRHAAGGASPADRAGRLHEDLGARRRGTARERRARLRRPSPAARAALGDGYRVEVRVVDLGIRRAC